VKGLESAVDGIDYLEWREPSDSTPDKFYHVRLWLRDWRGFKANSLSCDCPRWIYQKKPLNEKSCKHTQRIANQRLVRSQIIDKITGSEVTFNEELIATKGNRIEALKRELESLK